MIKKILSVVLSLGMLLTLVSSLPVAAAGEALPYIFEDFEADGNAAGPYGIGKALKTEGAYSIDIAGLDALFAGNVKVSFNIKADEDATAKIALVSEYELDTLPANEWVAVEEIIAVDGNIADTFAITADSAFAIDDLKVEADNDKSNPALPEEESELTKAFTYDFTDGADIDVVSAYKVDNSTGAKTEVDSGKIDYYKQGTRHFAKIEPDIENDDTTVFLEITPKDGFVSPGYKVLREVTISIRAMQSSDKGAEVFLDLGNGKIDAYEESEEITSLTVTDDNKLVFIDELPNTNKTYEFSYKQTMPVDASGEADNKVVIGLKAKECQSRMNLYLDDITVTDYYEPANVAFDEIVVVEEANIPWAWAANNATISAEEGVATVTATAAGASIAQDLAFENGYKYVVSFNAKGTEGDTLIASVGNATKEFTLTESMEEYSIIYRAEDDGVFAYPELKFALKDAAADDVFSIASIGVAKKYNYKLANIEDVVLTGDLVEKNTITVSYDEVADEDIEILATVVSLYQEKDGYNVCVDTVTETSATNEVTLELPANCAGEEFFVEVTSFTAGGQGETVSEELGAATAAVTYSGYSAELVDSTATVSLSLENNRAAGADDIKAIILVVLLDENGILVGFDTEEVVIAAGESDDFSLEVAATNGTAASYKVFVLDCADATTPSLANTTMRELVTLD